MATLTKKEWDQIRGRRSETDIKYLFMLLQRDGEITIQNHESGTKDEGETKDERETED